MNEDRIAEIDVLFVPPENCKHAKKPKDGYRGVKVRLGIGDPSGPHPGRCFAYFDGWDQPRCSGGTDEWQALFRSINFVRTTLRELEKSGWTFEVYLADSEKSDSQPGDLISLDNLFSITDSRKFSST